MEKLNFPVFSLHIKSRENKHFIFEKCIVNISGEKKFIDFYKSIFKH